MLVLVLAGGFENEEDDDEDEDEDEEEDEEEDDVDGLMCARYPYFGTTNVCRIESC